MLKPTKKKTVNISLNNLKKDNLPVSNLTLDAETHNNINDFLDSSSSVIKSTNESGLPVLAKYFTYYTPDHMYDNGLPRFFLFHSIMLIELISWLFAINYNHTPHVSIFIFGVFFFFGLLIVYLITTFSDDESLDVGLIHQIYALPLIKLSNLPNRNKDKAIIEDAQKFFSENDDEKIIEDYINGAGTNDKRYLVINKDNENIIYYFINIDNYFIHVTSVYIVNGLICEYASRSRYINILDKDSRGDSLKSITPDKNETFDSSGPHNFCYSYSKRWKKLVRIDKAKTNTFRITNPVKRERGERVDIEVKDNDKKIFEIEFNIKDGKVDFYFEEKSKNTYLFYKKNKDIIRGKEGIATKIRSMGGRVFSGCAVGFLE